MKKTFAATLALCLATSLAAQDTPTKVTASFYAFDYAPQLQQVSIRVAEQAFEEITLSKANIVGPIEALLVNGNLTIHGAAVETAGEVTLPVVASARIPNQIQNPLIVVFPAPEGQGQAYNCLVLDHAPADFPLGVYRMINASPFPVRGAIARSTIEAMPGNIANLKPAGEPGTTVPMRFEYFENDRWNLLTETRSAIRNDRRWLVCIYQDARTGRLNLRSIPDRSHLRQPPREEE